MNSSNSIDGNNDAVLWAHQHSFFPFGTKLIQSMKPTLRKPLRQPNQPTWLQRQNPVFNWLSMLNWIYFMRQAHKRIGKPIEKQFQWGRPSAEKKKQWAAWEQWFYFLAAWEQWLVFGIMGAVISLWSMGAVIGFWKHGNSDGFLAAWEQWLVFGSMGIINN